MSFTDSGTHWLAVMAEYAGLRDFPISSAPSLTELAAAWEQVALASGLSERELLQRITRHFRAGEASLGNSEAGARRLVPAEVAKEHGFLPLRKEGDVLVVASSDPSRPGLHEALRELNPGGFQIEVAAPTPLLDALDLFYTGETASGLEGLVAEAAAELGTPVFGGAARWGTVFSEDMEPDPPSVVALTDALFMAAVDAGASDVLFDPPAAGGKVRFRVDGMVREVQQLPDVVHTGVVRRLRLKCGLPIQPTGDRENGVGTMAVSGTGYLLKFVTSPTADGAKTSVGISLADREFRLDHLGLTADAYEQVRTVVAQTGGLYIVAGPTGSGVTTLVYAILSRLAGNGLDVCTLENPIEHDVNGLSQRQFRASEGRSYSDVLYEILGQEPDVLFGGEARDVDTLRAALRASVTGRRVYMTVHTHDAVGALARLGQVGVDGRELSTGVRGVIAQRLLRRLCTCAKHNPGPQHVGERERALAARFRVRPAAAAVGCERCAGTGYRGLVPVTEVLVVTSKIARLLEDGEPFHKIEAVALADGMRLMVEQALQRVEAGETSLEEVERVLGAVPPPAAEDGQERSVLVVDDSPEDRALIRAILERKGIRVVEAEDTTQAREALAQEDVSLMLLDLRLPGEDGLSFLRALREGGDAERSVPVVVLTSSQNPNDEISLIQAGADDYLLKPIDPRRLSVRIDAAFRRLAGYGSLR